MISDKNILRFLYFLFFIFLFSFISHTSFNHILANFEKRNVLVISHFTRKNFFHKDLAFSKHCIHLSQLNGFYIEYLGQRGVGVSEHVTTLSYPITLQAHVLLASASTHFLDHSTLGTIYERGRGGNLPSGVCLHLLLVKQIV